MKRLYRRTKTLIYLLRCQVPPVEAFRLVRTYK